MAGRFPRPDRIKATTSARYCVFEGYGDLFDDFPDWVRRATGLRTHGHLFAPERAEFADGHTMYSGALSDNPTLRDYNPSAFLTNLIWTTRGERQAFLYGPRDTPDLDRIFPYDPNADVMVVTGAWAVRLFRSDMPFAEIRQRAALLQKREDAHLQHLRSRWVKARVRITTMADFVETPMEALQTIVDQAASGEVRRLSEVPRMVDLTGFGQFLQSLKNQGMHPYLMGDFPADPIESPPPAATRKPYLVR